jgi:hypothetical protein
MFLIFERNCVLTSACAAAEREEQVFIQALSLATWSAELGVYLVMSGVQTEGLTGAPAPHPGVPRSGLMLAYPFCSLQSSLLKNWLHHISKKCPSVFKEKWQMLNFLHV